MTGANVEAIIARLTTLGLVPWGEPVDLTAGRVSEIRSMARHEGLVCLLGAAIERKLVRVDPVSERLVADAWIELMAAAVQLDGLLLSVHAALAGAGVPMRVLKGVATATLDEIEPTWRSYNDVDVLVPSDRLLHAVDSLVAHGMQPLAEPVSRSWAGRYAKSITLTHESGAQVDVHRMLAAGPFGSQLGSKVLFAGGRSLRVGDTTVVALSDAQRFLHACYHAALGGVRGARHRRDVLLLARSVRPIDVADLFGRGWSSAVVIAALQWAGEGAGALTDEWAAWLQSVRPQAAEAALLAAYGGSFRDIALAELHATKGPLAKSRYAAALVWPSRQNLAARGHSRWQHLRRLAGAGSPSVSAAEGARS